MRILFIILSLVCLSAFAEITPEQFEKTKELAEKGDPEAQCNLGEWLDMAYERDHDTFNQDQAVKWYLKAAEQGYARAQANIGDRYYMGNRGLPEDDKEAVKWYRRASEQGSAWALARLGLCYERGRGVPKNYVEAYACFNVAGANDVGANNKIFAAWRDSLAKIMTPSQIEAGQKRSLELSLELQAKIDSR